MDEGQFDDAEEDLPKEILALKIESKSKTEVSEQIKNRKPFRIYLDTLMILISCQLLRNQPKSYQRRR